jgi:1-acyl-sn-glycerol-3-phosphate acyltransferase
MFFRTIHSLFFYFLAILGSIIGTILVLIFVPFSKSKTRPFQIAAHLWARFLAFFSGVKVKVSGFENIPKDKPVILASNHQGVPDIILLLAYLPVLFRFAIKKELFKIPVFGWYLKKAGYFMIDRAAALSAYQALEEITEIIKAGESAVIFPEGTRTKTGILGKFKRGSLLAALKSGAPIIPIAISGSFDIMPPGTWILNPHPLKLSVGKPIYIRSEADYEDKVEEVREAIARML